MAKRNSLSDILHYTNRKTYSNTRGNIAYLETAPLRRPFKMPAGQRVIAALVVAVAIALGIIFVNTTVLSSLRETAAAEQAIAENLARPASIETLPKIKKLINRNDAGIIKVLDKAGYTYYDASSTSDSGDLILYKLPDDVSVEEAAAWYAKGISALSAPEATKLLNGSWQLVAERSDITSVVVRYADFTTGDPQIALQSALAQQGFDPESITDSGIDDSGNTYSMGTFDTKKGTCSWKISAIELDDMFSFSNMPEDACYIGIRATKQ